RSISRAATGSARSHRGRGASNVDVRTVGEGPQGPCSSRSARHPGCAPRRTRRPYRGRTRNEDRRSARGRREASPRPRPWTRRDRAARACSQGNDGRATSIAPGVRRGDLRRALALVRRRTHRDPPLPVRLMERDGCHLCVEAHRALRRIALDIPLEIERVDIAALATDVRDRYELRIPVLVAGDDELDAAGLDDAAIVRWLRMTKDRSGRAG